MRTFSYQPSVRRRSVGEELRFRCGCFDGLLLFGWGTRGTDTGGEEGGIGGTAFGEGVDDL
jgi:hypothetical protein